MYCPKHVLILDDNSIDIFILEDIINRIGLASSVHAFDRPTLAVEYLSNCNIVPDLIFVDLKMPVLSGFEFIDWVSKKYPNTKFIMMSTSDDFLDIQKSFTYPQVINYIVKPITSQALSNLRLAS